LNTDKETLATGNQRWLHEHSALYGLFLKCALAQFSERGWPPSQQSH